MADLEGVIYGKIRDRDTQMPHLERVRHAGIHSIFMNVSPLTRKAFSILIYGNLLREEGTKTFS